MILVVALNPALDVTYDVEQLRVARTNRVTRVRIRAGGKPLNVARVLGVLGVEVIVVGLGADSLPERFADESAGLPVSATWVPPGGRASSVPPARRTVVVVDRSSGDVTAINEAGPVTSAADWKRLRSEVRSHLPAASAVVLAGSLPPGLPLDAYAMLTRDARTAGTWVALDTDDPWLGPALAAAPDLAKPNGEELARAGLGNVTGVDGARQAAARLCRNGPGAVVVSMGADGLVAAAEGGCWVARSPQVSGNATGAGDAALAGLVSASADGLAWPERLRRAAALGAAAVAEPVAGELRLATYRDLLAATQVHA